MSTTQLKTIMPGVTARFGAKGITVRFTCMVRGRRFAENCQLPAAMLISGKTGKATMECKAAYAEFVQRMRNQVGWSDGRGLRVPTIEEFRKAFEEMAWQRTTISSYRYEEKTANNAIKNLKMCIAESGLRPSDEVTKLMATATIRRIYESFRRRVTGVSAWAYVQGLKSATAMWTREKYQELGMEVASPVMPDVGIDKDPPRYQRLPKDLVERIEGWYRDLDKYLCVQDQLAVTLVYNTAMRPEDTSIVTSANFSINSEDGYWHLVYKPSKTSKSSKRWVNYPIPTALVERIKALAGDRWEQGLPLVGNRRTVFDRVNNSMRIVCQMPTGEFSKAVYELRKLAIDTIYHQRGSQAASALSGDNQSTIEYYYADPGMVTNVAPLMVAPSANAACA